MRAAVTLLRKELRSLAPLGLLGFALISGDLVSRPLTERIDENTYEHVAGIAPGEGGFLAFIFWILAFFVAYAAFPREHDERTIEHLYALPVKRATIFFAKVSAGLLTLVAVAFLGQATNWLLQALNPNSVNGHQFELGLVSRVATLHAAVACVLYFHGLFASVFRLFGVLPYAILFFSLLLVEQLVPSLAWLNPAVLVRFEYEGRTLLWPWGSLAFHGAVAALAGAAAYAGWMGPFDRVRELFATRSTRATLLLALGIAAVAGSGFVALVVWVVVTYSIPGRQPEDPSAPRPVTERDFGTAEARTAYYAFVYPASFEEPVLRLVGRSDRLLETVTRVVDFAEPPFITVDLAEESAHHEGIASGTRVRMGVRGQRDWRLLHVLAHESAHVLQGEMSRRYLMDHGATTRFFVEGSAEWVAFEALAHPSLVGVATDEERREDAELRRFSRLVAAAAWERNQVRLEDTFDDASFRARFDTTLAYPYGETFAEAIARACGQRAVGALIRAFARPGAPQGVRGEALYRDALSSIGCDYEAVLIAHDALMAETVRAERAVLDALPRLSGGVVGGNDATVLLEAVLDRAPRATAGYLVRVRNDAGAADTEVRGFSGELDTDATPPRVRFVVPRIALTGARFEFLFSQEVDARAFPLAETWQSAPVP